MWKPPISYTDAEQLEMRCNKAAVGGAEPVTTPGMLAQLRALDDANSRRTASAFSAAESGSVAIMARAAAKPPSPSLEGPPLPVFVSGVQAGVQARFAPLVSA